MTTSTNFPSSALRLTGELDTHLSRWLWLVKMFLALPHYLVLGVLWIAFILVTMVAGVCILFTGHYPHRLFEFNAGVLRWNWRVGFYVYAALGTDRYPPFTLARTDYPAEIEISYPARLSRRLVLVKWLLAAPHLIIVGLIVADTVLYPWSAASGTNAAFQPASGYSVLNLLVVAGGVFLLVTGKYPRSLFSFVMGINRWIYRVLIYVALLSDEYPPLRFDGGPFEPGCMPVQQSLSNAHLPES